MQGIHKPEVGSSILLPATRLRDRICLKKIELISGVKPRTHLFGAKFLEGFLQMILMKWTSDHNQLTGPTPLLQLIMDFELQLHFLLWQETI